MEGGREDKKEKKKRRSKSVRKKKGGGMAKADPYLNNRASINTGKRKGNEKRPFWARTLQAPERAGKHDK